MLWLFYSTSFCFYSSLLTGSSLHVAVCFSCSLYERSRWFWVGFAIILLLLSQWKTMAWQHWDFPSLMVHAFIFLCAIPLSYFKTIPFSKSCYICCCVVSVLWICVFNFELQQPVCILCVNASVFKGCLLASIVSQHFRECVSQICCRSSMQMH